MRRAVFDTTVLVAALLRPGGLADELLTLAAEEQFELILSSAIILETWRTLLSDERIRSRYSYSDERAHLYCLSLLEVATEVLRTTRPLSGIVRDPRDDMVWRAPWTAALTALSAATRTCFRSVPFGGPPLSRPKFSGSDCETHNKKSC
jgi:predicted nucleic acid-binding protein